MMKQSDIDRETIKLETEDIQLIVKLLHQELEAVQTIINNNTHQKNHGVWCKRANHLEDLIIQLLK